MNVLTSSDVVRIYDCGAMVTGEVSSGLVAEQTSDKIHITFTRSFSVAGPRIWNSLPASLRQPDIELGHFEQLLKAFLFGEAAAH